MLAGFISLLLTVGQDYVSKICIPAKATNFMLPCRRESGGTDGGDNDHDRRRKLLSYDEEVIWRRALAGALTDHCSKYKVRIIISFYLMAHCNMNYNFKIFIFI